MAKQVMTIEQMFLAPSQEQKNEMKAKFPDAICLWRVANEYRVYGEDAKTVCTIILNIDSEIANTLGGGISEYRFDHMGLDRVLPQIIAAGHRVAICEFNEEKK